VSQPFGSNRDSVSPLLDATTKNPSYLSADSSSRKSPYSKTQSESRNLIWSLAMIFASSKSLVPRVRSFHRFSVGSSANVGGRPRIRPARPNSDAHDRMWQTEFDMRQDDLLLEAARDAIPEPSDICCPVVAPAYIVRSVALRQGQNSNCTHHRVTGRSHITHLRKQLDHPLPVALKLRHDWGFYHSAHRKIGW
jgi:hypothetical protein